MRRVARSCLAVGVYVVLASFAPRGETAEPTTTATAAPATDALTALRAGNDRFVRRMKGHSAAPVPSTIGEAAPPTAAVLSCAESRLPAEYIFDAMPGQLLVVRSLGAVADTAVVASLEYAVETGHAPVLVVMGHDACDAVALGSAGAPASENLQFVAKAIRAGRRSAGESTDVRTMVLATVEQTINDVMSASPLLRQAAATHALLVVGAYFDAESGVVAFSDPVVVAADGSVRH